MFIEYPYLFVFVCLILFGLFFSLPVFKFIDENCTTSRNQSIDALRFFLASFVVFSHAFYIRDIVIKGTWTGHTSPEIAYLAHIGVTMFFMITGYLFWGKVKRGNVDWINLFKDRVLRIAPLIFFNVLCIVLLTSLITKSIPNKNVIHWFNVFMNNLPNYSSFENAWSLTASVRWTLVYEWAFYFSLPLLSFFIKKPLEFSMSLVLLSFFVPSFFPQVPRELIFFNMFFLGMLASDISDVIGLNKIIVNIVAVAVVALILVFKPVSYSLNSILNPMLTLLLLCMVKGADMFGFLSVKGFKRLGDASYSIYIMHALIIYVVFKVANKYDFLDTSESSVVMSVIAMIFVFSISLLTYNYVEKTFINFGKKINLKQSIDTHA